MAEEMFSERGRELAARLARVRSGLEEAAGRAGRNPAEVLLVAVSKLHPASDVAELARAGQVRFGESYVQEARDKQAELAGLDVSWHFIGGLQSNKAKFVAGRFDLVHSLDSLKLAQVLHKRALELGVRQDVLIQVGMGGEEHKRGVAECDLPVLAEQVAGLKGLRLAGLMVMPPFFEDPELSRPYFSRLRELRDGLEARLGQRLGHLSMGMSADYRQAVAEGATLVRIGTDIFGPRPCKLGKT
ncbi:MAG: YggS family pyridoxal phosphate-dependent enzyme [Desulfovibrionaceae bacterium]|nr:YggS family pyridoxal phosphate-dependent enzyme [Desulfovibrionaceae bacterium]